MANKSNTLKTVATYNQHKKNENSNQHIATR